MRSTLVPEVVNLHVTSVCNLHCKYCFGQFPEIARPPPKTDWWRIIEEVSAAGVHRVNFSGGEPTLLPELVELLEHARSLGLATSIVTNGKKLTDKVIALCDAVALSVDSDSDEVNKALGRVTAATGGSYLRVIQLLAGRVHSAGKVLKVNTVVTRFNVHQDLRRMYRSLRPAKVKLLQFRRVVGENEEQAAELEVTRDEFDAFVERQQSLKAEGIWVQEESEAMIAATYVMVNPEGRLFQHAADGGHCLSRPVAEVGLVEAMCDVGGYDRAEFERRGGHVDVRSLIGGVR